MLQEARGRLLRGWSRDAQARDAQGQVVLPWSDDAVSWSLLGALLAAWNRQDGLEEADFVAHRADAQGLGDATRALSVATGTPALDRWNDAEGRNVTEVVAAVDQALAVLDGAG
jgi:ABC-type branched-subunit amino acid transport system substrate-binding protein